ncbi:MAG: ATP-binding protein [Candidatus Sedimenticola sp. (ex Thyasira tokunagai)]
MKFKILPVKNVSRLNEAGQALIQRDLGMPGMGLIWGPTGYGKTTAATWFINQCHGVYIRAMRLWTPKSMLTAMARELDLDVKGRSNAEMVESVIQRLAATNRPVFIDEADYIVESRRLTDTLRDIHDLSTVPVILIGMHGIEKKIRGNEQFTGRIAQWVSFEGLDLVDARLLADGLVEVKIKDDLLHQLHKAASPKSRQGGASSGAEVRRLVVGLGRIEQYARSRGLQSIGAADWVSGNEFFIGQAA